MTLVKPSAQQAAFEKGDRVTMFSPGDQFDSRRGFVAKVSGSTITVDFDGAFAYDFQDYELVKGWW